MLNNGRIKPMRQRVLILSPCMGTYGGLEAFVLAIGSSLAANSDFEVRVMFREAGDFNLRDDLRAGIAATGLPVTFCKRGSRELIRAIAWADVVHLQNLSADVAFLARLLGKRLLITIHAHNKGGNSLHTWSWRAALRLAHRRFFISRFVRGTWDPAGRLRDSHIVPSVSKLPEGRVSEDQRRGFAFIGRWIANKGVDTLVEAYRQAGLDPDQWPLRLMGHGPLMDSIKETIERNSLRGVEILGFVDDEQKAEVIRRSKFMVIPPNTREDFGLTALEARNLGVPCIITRDGGLPEAGGADVIACEPGNTEELKQALCRAAAMSDQEYQSMAQRTYETLQHELIRPTAYADYYRAMCKNGKTETAPAVPAES